MNELHGFEEDKIHETLIMEEITKPNRNSSSSSATPVTIALGGPIYVPNLVGSLTSVREFEASALHSLLDLEAELCLDSSVACEDISVDELKIFGEEELVNKALEEAFKVEEEVASSSQVSEQLSSHAGSKDMCKVPTEDVILNHSGKRKKAKASDSIDSTNAICTIPIPKGKCSKNKLKIPKEGPSVDDSYLVRVEKVVKIKEKQDEDKAAAKLHCFNGCKKNMPVITPSEKLKRMEALRSTSSEVKVKSPYSGEHIAVQDPEVILCIEVYHNKKPSLKTQEFIVLGRQSLTELRDYIYCVMDQAMHDAGQYDPSGYFMIEDVFYNDLRDRSAIDYSKPIFDWLKNSKDEALEKWEFITSGELQKKQKTVLGYVTPQLPQFRAADMNKTRFCDLKFRLGANYLYCHQGDCKHTIVIRDMRLVHPEDANNRAVYPLQTFQTKPRVQKCSVCKIYRATRVTVDDKWAQENPCYFCDNCFHCLHYSEDNLLLYSGFEEYKYYHEQE